MPCLEITMPRQTLARRAALATALTEAFASITPFGGDIFSIRFAEYGPGEVSTGGRLWDGGTDGDCAAGAYVHYLLYCPRIRRELKQRLVRAFTDIHVRVAGGTPVIHIAEHPYDNVGVDGRLLSDAFEACASRPFYYELPRD